MKGIYLAISILLLAFWAINQFIIVLVPSFNAIALFLAMLFFFRYIITVSQKGTWFESV
jgi:hypothetical protein